MRIRSVLNIFIITIMGIVLINSAAFAAEPSALASIENIAVRDVYEPGNGSAVGKIRQVSGTVLILHQEQKHGYRAEEGLDLFKGDIVLTGKDGNAAFVLNDGSFISLSQGTRMKINRSVYAVKQKTRSSFLNMVSGKARFVVKKFVDARHSEFKVKTRTSVAGVRGSDFIINASETVTEITTLEKTELAVISLADPDAEPVILHDFEKTEIRIGMRPEEVQRVKSEDIDRLMKEFKFRPLKENIQQQMGQAPSISGQGADTPVQKLKRIYVPRKDLIRPRFQKGLQALSTSEPLQEIFRSKKILMDEQNLINKKTTIYQNIKETIQTRPLPDFPPSPK